MTLRRVFIASLSSFILGILAVLGTDEWVYRSFRKRIV